MNRKRFAVICLLAAFTLLASLYGTQAAGTVFASPNRADSPLPASDSPLGTPDSPLQSPLGAPGGVAPLSPLAPDSLANMVYHSVLGEDRTVKLVDGGFTEEAAGGLPNLNSIRLRPEHTAYGKLNGQNAAAAILESRIEGYGPFYELAVVVDQKGEPVNVATTRLGESIQVNVIEFRDNQIRVDMVAHGDGDAACCPTQHVDNVYEVNGDEIVEVSSGVVGRVAPEALSQNAPPLEVTDWQLESYRGADGEMVLAVPDVKAVIRFEDDTVSGSAGCNTISGGYTVDGNTISVGPLRATLKACPEALTLQEQGGAAALGAAAEFIIYGYAGYTLRLYDAESKLLATYVAVPKADLVGPTWVATGYSSGKGGFGSVAVDTEITALFGEDGALRGSAGCNIYMASYTVDGPAIVVGPVATSRKMCAEPEGVMEQKEQYLAALSTAAIHRLDADTLELRTATGARVAAYSLPATPDIVGALDNLEYTYDAIDDVNGDDKLDAVALLTAKPGSEGDFALMGLINDAGGERANVANTLLGDRVKVHSIAIVAGQIIVDMIEHGPHDDACCPTQEVVNTYELHGGELVETSSEIVRGLTPVKLANMEYKVDETVSGSAWLYRGYYLEPMAPDSSDRILVAHEYMSMAFGEIEGVPSAVVVLRVEDSVNSGAAYYLALVQEEDGKPVHVASTLINDRAEFSAAFQSAEIADDQIIVDMVTQGRSDSDCCPSTRVIKTYALENGKPIEVSSEEQEMQVFVPELPVESVWHWQGSKYVDAADVTPDDASQYTVEFMNDGAMELKADCNSGGGQYTVDGQQITIEIGNLTELVCSAGSLEREFLRDLGAAVSYVLLTDGLVINLQGDAGIMLFAK